MSVKAAKAAELANAVQASSAFSSENVVYLMGLSFIIGSLFTILILILLDFMRRSQSK